MEKLIEEIYDLNLQNNTEKIDFDKAFKYGIKVAIQELKERNLLKL